MYSYLGRLVIPANKYKYHCISYSTFFSEGKKSEGYYSNKQINEKQTN